MASTYDNHTPNSTGDTTDSRPPLPHSASSQAKEGDFLASATALQTLTTAAAVHRDPPISHIHAASSHSDSHSWIRKLIPEHALELHEKKFKMGNFVVDRATGQQAWEDMSIYVRVGMHLLYYGKAQGKLLHVKEVEKLLEDESVKMGRMYDDPKSKEHILPFIQSFKLEESMREMVKEDPGDYATFNEFFAREIKEEARPVAEQGDERVAVSPADCRLTAFPTVELATRYWIKGYGFTVEKLLGSAEVAGEFEGGSIVIARLAPQDYHRWHAPVSGTVEGVKDIPGAYYTVNPHAINESTTLDVFCENKRSVMLVRTATGSRIAIIAVGAMLVGSLFYVREVDQKGAQIRRGQCLGGFKYGGSTIIVLYPKGEIVLDEDLVKNSTELQCETLMRVGWRVGITPSK